MPPAGRKSARSVAPSPLKSLPLTERTVRVAGFVVAVLALFVNTARNRLPWSAAVAVNAYVVDVAPAMFDQLEPLGLTCHCTVGVGVPEADAEKLAEVPAFRVRLPGCAVIDGGPAEGGGVVAGIDPDVVDEPT